MAEDGIICESAMEPDSKGTPNDENSESQAPSPRYTILADTVLVPHAVTDEETPTTDVFSDDEEMDDSHMTIIRRIQPQDGIPEATQAFLAKATRVNTRKAYDQGWRKGATWCHRQSPSVDPKSYDVQVFLTFLIAHQHHSLSSLNSIRSAIDSVYKILHPQHLPLAEQSLVIEFFWAKRRSEIRLATMQQIQTWDLDILTLYIKRSLRDNSILSLYDHQQKTSQCRRNPSAL
ncbi:uncharacterized protein BYT42DRAFT_500623 [Radiomyces spectabilis]|uniref:uncharacterized protein n=1 Tax=Radiomyces spectabilis TaxID=64574 RepID=UPI00221F06DD|nr:uncharacterized protein BYT42DRAFT_500623 [Radiomyces spectabilis]KAI8372858.1 hypothetical protein BYT42DRAFT_500623 [Radiomyces spectabilis]